MGLDDLLPGNTKRARPTAVNDLSSLTMLILSMLAAVFCVISLDNVFLSVMDTFGVYLAFHEGKCGKSLARNSCMQYYRQVKHWLLEQFPQI